MNKSLERAEQAVNDKFSAWLEGAQRLPGESLAEVQEWNAKYPGNLLIRDELASEYLFAQDFQAARRIRDENIERDPDNPMAVLSLVHHLRMVGVLKSDATVDWLEVRRLTTLAVQLADRAGHARRHSRNELARTLLELNDYEALDLLLIDIARLTLAHDAMDIGRESDFFDRADHTRLRPDTLEIFSRYLAARPPAPSELRD